MKWHLIAVDYNRVNIEFFDRIYSKSQIIYQYFQNSFFSIFLFDSKPLVRSAQTDIKFNHPTLNQSYRYQVLKNSLAKG